MCAFECRLRAALAFFCNYTHYWLGSTIVSTPLAAPFS